MDPHFGGEHAGAACMTGSREETGHLVDVEKWVVIVSLSRKQEQLHREESCPQQREPPDEVSHVSSVIRRTA